MALPVSQWLAQHPEYQMQGTTGNDIYFQVPKADGGYDYFRAYADAETDAPIISSIDPGQIPGFQQETTVRVAGSAGSGPSQAQIAAAVTAHNTAKKQIEAARDLGLYDVDAAERAIVANREQIKKDLQSGYEANQSYFSQSSPDAYQSQAKNYDTKVLDAYNVSNKTLDDNQGRIGLARNAVLGQFNSEIAANDQGLADYRASGTAGSPGYSYKTAAPVQGVANQMTAVDPQAAVQQSARPNYLGMIGGAAKAAVGASGPVGAAISAYNTGKDAIDEFLNK